jgi:uncharacterized membrane protein
MCKFVSTKISPFLLVSTLVVSAGCASTAEQDREDTNVSIARYNTHAASKNLEILHRIQINDTAGLREDLEDGLANDVNLIWSSVINDSTSREDREHAYSMLRLIAVQNEKFPIKSLSTDTDIMKILETALQNDSAHTEQLRRQDWSKPKWENWAK